MRNAQLVPVVTAFVGQAFRPDRMIGTVRQESLTYGSEDRRPGAVLQSEVAAVAAPGCVPGRCPPRTGRTRTHRLIIRLISESRNYPGEISHVTDSTEGP